MSTSKQLHAFILTLLLTASALANTIEPPIALESTWLDDTPTDPLADTSRHSAFCQPIRADREKQLRITPDLKPGTPLPVDHATPCFTPAENLLFVAHQEAQLLIGPHAPWYITLRTKSRQQVEATCKAMDPEDYLMPSKAAYDHCVNSRYQELMRPHEDRYRREAGGYIRQRRQTAESLVARCQAALNVKRPLLPKDLKFPAAYHHDHLSAIPNDLLEARLFDERWLKSKGAITVKDVMQDVLGADCPGNMVLWATYQPPPLSP